MRDLCRMRRRRAVRMGVTVVVGVIVAMVVTGIVAMGMGMRHRKMLYYNITKVHAGWTRLRDLAAHFARALASTFRAQEGAGKAGCTLHPRSRARCLRIKEMHTSIQVKRRQSGLPCAMALRLIARSPR